VKRAFWCAWKFDYLKKDAKAKKKNSIFFFEKTIFPFVA
jgi:hypothetical protein